MAHRVVEIIDTTNLQDWHHVSTHENPADCSSRGLLPSDFLSHQLWTQGPHWLMTPTSQWPIISVAEIPSEPLPEVKSTNTCLLSEIAAHPVLTWMERFSNFPKLCRIMSYVLRFLKARVGWQGSSLFCKSSGQTGLRETMSEILKRVPPVSVKEYNDSTTVLIKIVQSSHFEHLFHPKRPNRFLHIYRLNPILDTLGIIRVGGRLSKAPIPEETKHPILLPGKCHFTKMLIDHYHQMT